MKLNKKLAILFISMIAILSFAACNKIEFKISFIVDGEVYHTLNTNGSEIIKMPDNPIKPEYAFDGWFWDNDTWLLPFTANSLLDAPLSSDMSVYAKWKSNTPAMQITYMLKGIFVKSTLTSDFYIDTDEMTLAQKQQLEVLYL